MTSLDLNPISKVRSGGRFGKLIAQIEGAQNHRGFMWSNLYRVDVKGASVLRATPAVRQAIRSAQRGLLRDEVRILRPGVVVFLTGPNYDHEITAEFDAAEVVAALDGFGSRQFARIAHSDLPVNSFRTYHPRFLQVSGKGHLLEDLSRLVLA